jgi:YebC/PmpR family DNA-binding regulatory protein
MSGHSKWSTIRRKKAITDTKRGRIFTQIIKEMTIAARLGGGDPTANPRLRLAIEKAKASNMPADNIKRAIMKGTGELPGIAYEDATYEGYGPGGVALLIDAVTDNKTRTVSDIRHILDRNGGKLAATGAVSYQFHRMGHLIIPAHTIGEDDLLALVLEAGADDLKIEGDHFIVLCAPAAFEQVKRAIEEKGVVPEHAELQMFPENTVKVEGKEAEQVLHLMEALEDHDDVQHVYGNFDIDEKQLAEYAGE